MNHRFVLPVLLALFGCDGLVLDQAPGEGGSMLLGRVAVDPDTETSFAMDFETVQTEAGPEIVAGSIVAVRADGGPAVVVQDLEGTDYFASLAFAPGRVIVGARRTLPDSPPDEPVYESTLSAYDADTFAALGEARVPGSFSFLEQSASGRWALTASYEKLENGPAGDDHLYLVDLAGLVLHDVTTTLPSSPVMGQASDTLFGFVEVAGVVHLRSWSIEALVAADFAVDESGSWAGASIDIALPDAFLNGAYAVLSPGDDNAFLQPSLIVDLASGELREVHTDIGTPTFTPDGSTIVGFLPDQPGQPAASSIVTIDVETAEVTAIELPFADSLNFFVTRSGHDVVVAPYLDDGESLVLVDLSDGSTTRAGGAGLHLDMFTSRVAAGELWLLQDGSLYCLDLVAAQTDLIGTDGYDPWAINILPAHDQLVMQADQGLVFYDPSARAVLRTVPLR